MSRPPESCLQGELNQIIADRPVSLVGNAASLLQSDFGTLIDTGCVVRLNCGIPINYAAQGQRIDIHCFATRPSLTYNLAKSSWRIRLRKRYLKRAYPVWMSDKKRDLCTEAQQEFYPLTLWQELATELGASPSVGAATLHMLANLTNAEIRLFGFDFKASTTYYRRKENPGSHDWAAERDFAHSLTEARGWTIFS